MSKHHTETDKTHNVAAGAKRLLMLDSGAFSVWNNGAEVDLDAYIEFCADHPEVDYYVALDVIPGRPNDPASLNPDSKWESCRGGFENWERMIATLPKDKVIPVFHMGDDFYWMHRYLDAGVSYIGLSPANDMTTKQKKSFLDECRDYILHPVTKELIVKTHGFAVTSFDLMTHLPWHSVDSASWIRSASFGNIYVPRWSKKEKPILRYTGTKLKQVGVYPKGWQYGQKPYLVNFSPKSPSKTEKKHDPSSLHYHDITPSKKKIVDRYLEEMGYIIGEYTIIPASHDHKMLPKQIWLDKEKGQVVDPILPLGLSTCYRARGTANVHFLHKAEKALQKDGWMQHLYFAGSGQDELEKKMDTRLITYLEAKTKLFKQQLKLKRKSMK